MCTMAGVMVILLYISVLTIFLPFVVWDTQRVHNKRKECCGACFCKEDSKVFFGGIFLNPLQKQFSGFGTSKSDQKKDIEEQKEN